MDETRFRAEVAKELAEMAKLGMRKAKKALGNFQALAMNVESSMGVTEAADLMMDLA